MTLFLQLGSTPGFSCRWATLLLENSDSLSSASESTSSFPKRNTVLAIGTSDKRFSLGEILILFDQVLYLRMHSTSPVTNAQHFAR